MSVAIYIVGMLVCVVLGIQIGAIGAVLYMRTVKKDEPAPAPVVSDEGNTLTEEELEAIRKEREELIRSQEAFQRMIAYNADVAYGLARDDLSEEGS